MAAGPVPDPDPHSRLDTAVPRLRRMLTTTATSLVLLVLTALPAFAASGTTPDPDTDPWLLGSIDQLVTTAIVGLVVAVIAFAMLPDAGTAAEDEHH